MASLKTITDKDMQQIVGNLLRIGVYLSMIVVIIGGAIFLFDHANEKVSYTVFTIEKVKVKTIGSILTNVATFNGVAIVQFGLLMLIFTPIARVVLAVISFFLEKDYLYVLIGLIVLSVILVSLSGGFAH